MHNCFIKMVKKFRKGECKMPSNSLVGNFTRSLDAKGRVFFPAEFREDLGTPFIITVSLDKSLVAYSMDEWENFQEKLRSLPKTQVKDITRFFNGNAYKAEPDKQGRVMLNKEHLAFASIKEDVTFIGCGDRVELWAAAMSPLDKYDDTFLSNITDQMIELGI